MHDQFAAYKPREKIVTIELTQVDLQWLLSDLNHAVVKLGCRHADAFDLCERLEFILETGAGDLVDWY
ncbi:MAG: hypothetical protein ACKOUR_02480 [Planctomycetota bacterium]